MNATHDIEQCECPCHEDDKQHREVDEAKLKRELDERMEYERRREIYQMRENLYASKQPQKGLLLIRFKGSMLQRFINSICSRKSVLSCYGGKTFAYASDFRRDSGQGWEDGYSLGLVRFDRYDGCSKWLMSDTTVNQHDWLDGPDIVGVPMLRNFKKKNYNFFSLGTFMIDDAVSFHDFAQDAVKRYQAAGAKVIVASPAVEKFRGIWRTDYFMICQWKDEKAFREFRKSEPCQQTQSWLEESSCGCVTLTDVETNIPASASYKRPKVCEHPH